MSYAGKNLKYIRKQREWTQEEMANQIQIKRSLVGAYEEERAEPRLEVMESICALFSINLEQFLFQDLSLTGSMEGDGEGSSGNSSKNNYLERRRALKSDKSNSLAPIVPFVPVKAAAGYLAGYADPEFLDELNTFTLPMLAPGDYRAFEIIGDSMLPTPSGSVIVGEKVASFKEVKNSNTYIVVSNSDGVVYKRIITNDDRSKEGNGDRLTLLSDNPLYEPYQVNTTDIVEIWKAVYIIHKAGAQPMWNVDQLAGVVNNLQDQITSLKNKLN
jgi:DNA-binding XRE family transcriptional regulator/phage repressor protein C with HTH and peptisase S24 domain